MMLSMWFHGGRSGKWKMRLTSSHSAPRSPKGALSVCAGLWRRMKKLCLYWSRDSEGSSSFPSSWRRDAATTYPPDRRRNGMDTLHDTA